MTKEELELAGLRYANKWLKELTTLLFRHIPDPHPLNFDRELDALRARIAADIPPGLPKTEPEVAQAYLRKIIGDLPSTDDPTS